MAVRGAFVRRFGRRLLTLALAFVLTAVGSLLDAHLGGGTAAAAETTYTHFDGETVTYRTEVPAGEPLRVTGTGWLAKPDRVDPGEEGSVVGFKLIDDTLGQLERQVGLDNPRLGDPVGNDTVWGVVWADSAGAFEIDLEWPDATTARTDPQWTPGTRFTLQILSGTLYGNQPGANPNERPDVSRTVAVDVTVVAAGPAPTAPAVTTHPQDALDVARGDSVSFTAAADGTPAPTVQWQRSTALSGTTAPTAWVDVAGATSPTLTIADAGTNPYQNNRWFRAVFTNDRGSATSDPARLSVAPAPTVTTHPVGVTVAEGGSATFTAAASSAIPATVQWQSTSTARPDGEPDEATWADVPGATAATLTVPAPDAAAHGTSYRAVFTNGSGSTGSQPAQLRFAERLDTHGSLTYAGESYGPVQPNQAFTVSAPNAVVAGQPIVITGTGFLHPDGAAGSVANFLVDAAYSGDPNTLLTTREVTHPVTGAVLTDKRAHAVVQAGADGTWRVEIPWPDTTNTTRDQAFLDTAWATGTHHMVRVLTGSLLNGDFQRGISVPFTVVDAPTRVDVAPTVTTHPQDVAVTVGTDAAFTAAATGSPEPTVQWQTSRDGIDWVDVAGATGTTLTVPAATVAHDGTLVRAVFTNAAGQAVTATATLTVSDPDAPVVALPRTEVEQGGHVWFDLSRFTPGDEVVAELLTADGTVIATAFFGIGPDGRTVNVDGQTYQRVTVPRDAAPGEHTVRVRTAGGDVLAANGPVTVTAATTRVFNPGDHAAGEEDVLVQRGGVWTFRATAFRPGALLTATTEVAGETVTLSGTGQVSDTEHAWRLDVNGDTDPGTYTRVRVPGVIPQGPVTITFTDGTTTVERTLTIEAPAPATVEVAPTGEVGGTVRLTGTGFYHPTSTEQGSRIAVKINDGQLERVDTSAHSNRSIWYVIDAGLDGAFDVQVPLPNGTDVDDAQAGTLGSTPVLAPGEYTLRLLSGALLTGDVSRTLQTAPFTVTGPQDPGPEDPGPEDPGPEGPGPEEPPTLTGQIEVTFGVAAEAGGLSLNLAGTGVDLGTARLSPGIDRLVAEGALPVVRIADTRASDLGWSVTGLASRFTGTGGATLDGAALGWTPRLVSATPGQLVQAGPQVTPGTGLGAGATLVQAAPGQGRGTADADAGLRLEAPTTTGAGSYSATITLTLS